MTNDKILDCSIDRCKILLFWTSSLRPIYHEMTAVLIAIRFVLEIFAITKRIDIRSALISNDRTSSKTCEFLIEWSSLSGNRITLGNSILWYKQMFEDSIQSQRLDG